MVHISEPILVWDGLRTNVIIQGDSIEELVKASMPYVRPTSKKFYRKEIEKDLWKQGYSWIDVHAGSGIAYYIFIRGVQLPDGFLGDDVKLLTDKT